MATSSCDIVVAPDSASLSRAAVNHIVACSAAAIVTRGKFVVALSGGSMPKLLAPLVDQLPSSDWAHWHVFFSDERCVPIDHEDSNYAACRSLLAHVPPKQVHALPVGERGDEQESASVEDPAELARIYEAELRAACSSGPTNKNGGASNESASEDVTAFPPPVLDLCLLGMGPDGHTASLFPGHPLAEAAPNQEDNNGGAAVSFLTDSPKPPASRITLTLPVLNASRSVAFLAAGGGKAEVLARCFSSLALQHAWGTPSLVPNPASGYPCATVQCPNLTWFVDAAAAEQLPKPRLNVNPPLEGGRPVGLLGAMPQEIANLRAHVQNQVDHKINDFVTVVTGTLEKKKDDASATTVSVAFCSAGVGMVAAAAAATLLVERFNVRALLFTGVAGGLVPTLQVGDLLVATDCVNYDMDCRNFTLPWDPNYRHALGELPFTGGLKAFPSAKALVALALAAPRSSSSAAAVPSLPPLLEGRLATGSEFLSTERKAALAPVWAELAGGGSGGSEDDSSGSGKVPLAVDMECAGVAQVCHMNGVPFLGLRAISDTTEGNANSDFNAFCESAADGLWPIVEHVALHA